MKDNKYKHSIRKTFPYTRVSAKEVKRSKLDFISRDHNEDPPFGLGICRPKEEAQYHPRILPKVLDEQKDSPSADQKERRGRGTSRLTL